MVYGLTVRDLIALLEEIPDNKQGAFITIGGELVHKLELPANGRVRPGHGADSFNFTPKGRELGVRFLRWGEISDGSQELLPI